MLGLVGRKLLDGFTENTPQYKALPDTDTSEQYLLKKQELNKFMAVLLLRNYDEERF